MEKALKWSAFLFVISYVSYFIHFKKNFMLTSIWVSPSCKINTNIYTGVR